MATATDKIPRIMTMMQEALGWCQDNGATHASISCGIREGFNVDVRHQDLESLAYEGGVSFDVSVVQSRRSGASETSNGTREGLQTACEKALYIAGLTEEDEGNVAPEKELMAWHMPELSLSYPWAITVQEATALGCELEAYLEKDAQVSDVESVSVSTHLATRIHGDTSGFIKSYSKTFHSLYACALAELGGMKHRDSGYALRLDASDLPSVRSLAELTADRVKERLGAKVVPTTVCPVILSARVSASLVQHFLHAISGYALYRGTTFLLDSMDQMVWSDGVYIQETPHAAKHVGARPFDGEGVLTKARTLVDAGRVQGYLLDTYSAKKLGMQSTGHAGRTHATQLTCDNTCDTLADLMQEMGTGLVVTELIGQGVNGVTGDYSRGVVGFWVENGIAVTPVHEMTIAGNLKEMFANVVGMANDDTHNRSIEVGSLLISEMTVAGC